MICSRCDSPNVRPSKLRQTLFALPYRCRDCNELIWVRRKIFSPFVLAFAASVLVSVTIAVFGLYKEEPTNVRLTTQVGVVADKSGDVKMPPEARGVESPMQNFQSREARQPERTIRAALQHGDQASTQPPKESNAGKGFERTAQEFAQEEADTARKTTKSEVEITINIRNSLGTAIRSAEVTIKDEQTHTFGKAKFDRIAPRTTVTRVVQMPGGIERVSYTLVSENGAEISRSTSGDNVGELTITIP